MADPQKVSFIVRRPTPISRDASSGPDSDAPSFKVPTLPRHLLSDESTLGSPLARSQTSSPKPSSSDRPYYGDGDSSSGEDEGPQDELVTGFDRFGVERCVLFLADAAQIIQLTLVTHDRLNKPKEVPKGPLVIPALKNKDWRELARKRRTNNQFLPDSARAGVGADGSVGGLGTHERIGEGQQLSGLLTRKKESVKVKEEEASEVREVTMEVDQEIKVEQLEETEDQRALRALLSGDNGEETSSLTIPAISTPMSEADAYKQDVDELPDSASLDDYNRVPVSQFGAALLRGMGWKEGTAASRKGKGVVEPYLPEARPALLGIGAKEMETFDDGGKKGSSRPERRYVPVVKKDKDGNIISDSNGKKRDSDRGDRRRDRSISPRRDSRASSRRGSPDRRDYDDGQRDTKSRHGDYDDRRRDRDRDYRRRDERDRERERDRDKDRRRNR